MSELEDYDIKEEDTVKVFKLITGEEIVTKVASTTDNFFVIEIPLEICYNSIEKKLFLSRWKMGADYSKVMTLAGSAIVSVSGPEEIVLEHYFEYRDKLVKSFIEEINNTDNKDEHEQIFLNLKEDSTTFH